MDFAKLTPLNHQAKLAFSGVVEAALSSPNSPQLSHGIKFMSFEQHYADLGVSPTKIDNIGCESAMDFDSDAEVEQNVPATPNFQGYYSLSLSRRPRFPTLGWFIGLGRLGSPEGNGGVELQLASPETQFSKYQVAGKHARLNFDKSGSLVLRIVSTRNP